MNMDIVYRVRDDAIKKAFDLQPWPDYYMLRSAEIGTLLDLYGMTPVASILEIGCGNGFVSALLSNFADEVMATDLSGSDLETHTVGIARAGELFKRLGVKNCSPVSCRAESMPFKGGSFDMAIALYTLEHIPDRVAALKEINRVLKDGGRALFIVPSFVGVLLYPFSYYNEILMKGLSLFSGRRTDRSGTHADHSPIPDRRRGAPLSIFGRFRRSYPSFPAPDPHGDYANYPSELIHSLHSSWFSLAKKGGFNIVKTFTIMLFPKAFASIFMGSRSKDVYLRTLWLDKKLGRNAACKYLGQNICLVLEKAHA